MIVILKPPNLSYLKETMLSIKSKKYRFLPQQLPRYNCSWLAEIISTSLDNPLPPYLIPFDPKPATIQIRERAKRREKRLFGYIIPERKSTYLSLLSQIIQQRQLLLQKKKQNLFGKNGTSCCNDDERKNKTRRRRNEWREHDILNG